MPILHQMDVQYTLICTDLFSLFKLALKIFFIVTAVYLNLINEICYIYSTNKEYKLQIYIL